MRPWTFFENGVVVHVGFSDPFDDELRDLIHRSVEGKGVLEGETARMHDKGLLICMGSHPTLCNLLPFEC